MATSENRLSDPEQSQPATIATTSTNAGNQPDVTQLSTNEQIAAVAIVLVAMIMSLFVIIAWWPADPTSNKNALYSSRPFHVHFIDTNKTLKRTAITPPTGNANDSIPLLTKQSADLKALIDRLKKQANADTSQALAKAKTTYAETQDRLKKIAGKDAADKKIANEKAAQQGGSTTAGSGDDVCTIQLGNLLLVLVAAAGFLGNMIHVSKSLTYYIGMKKFQRSWIPWYFIKPFTASGLALLVYFATNSTGSGAAGQPINLFSIMLTAGLAGLFSDIATQKLKVIFEAILKPADDHTTAADRPAKPVAKTVSVDLSKVIPPKINPNIENDVQIPGQNLDPKNLAVKILGKKIDNLTVTDSSISFKYQPKDGDETKTEFLLEVIDTNAKLDEKKTWTI